MVSGDLLKRLRITLGNVSVPEHMHGDNLAILLASFYEDAEGEVDDNGWTETAIQAAQKTLDAIHAHYADHIEDLQSQLAEAKTVDVHPNSWAGLIAERDALQTQLAKAREDTLREAAKFAFYPSQKLKAGLGTNIHLACLEASSKILALINTPTPTSTATKKVIEWVWYGESDDGERHVSLGRWQKHPCQHRYKLAEIQLTEHDHNTPRQARMFW